LKRKMAIYGAKEIRPLLRIPFTPYFVCRWRFWKDFPNVYVIAKKQFKNGIYKFKEI